MARRTLVKGVIAIGSCLIFAGVTQAMPARAEEAASGLVDVQYGFMVNRRKCVGCKNCVAACRKYNKLSDDTPDRRRITERFDSHGKKYRVSTSCMHCDDPNCMRVCPAGAISKVDAGIVQVDKDLCIGCKYCFQACPYEVPRYNSDSMDKCDCCLGAGVKPGDQPYCVSACKFGALSYGPIDDLVAEAESLNHEVVRVGDACEPNCYITGEV
ncbi:Fe-S-cluster-containing hydrogenase subunit [Slackia heliotrinireducens DSM 20476]|uniref:Fe-S-cluster-containing hydrogenase subunit n=2 Tax=Slackia TaxID=84108 RepID=C7N272_SLAHD|nr:Fe-S-cluster-containing hydrogenase subunit [Slackia heliotrinireducens DSM 20476]